MVDQLREWRGNLGRVFTRPQPQEEVIMDQEVQVDELTWWYNQIGLPTNDQLEEDYGGELTPNAKLVRDTLARLCDRYGYENPLELCVDQTNELAAELAQLFQSPDMLSAASDNEATTTT